MSEAPQNRPWPPADSEPAPVHPKAPGPGTELHSHYDECFGCGEVDGGLHLKSTVGEQYRVFSQFKVTSAHQGTPGLAHGGLLASACDEALGATVGNLLRRPSVTGKLETDFVRPVPVGSTLFLSATVDGTAGRKIYASAEGRIDAEDGPVALRARAVFVEVPLRHFKRDKAKQPNEDWDVNP